MKNFINKKNFSRLRPNRGFSLAELLIAVSIFVALSLFVGYFAKDIFSFNNYIQADLRAQMEGRKAVVRMVSEMREMSSSSLGAYPIAAAATSSITFFSDIDSDTVKEQVRYYVQNGRVLKSVIDPSGNPLTYNPASAVVSTVISEISNSTSTPIFQYFGTSYAGTTTPLSTPVNISLIKLVKINMMLARRSSTVQAPLNITSNVVPRNLKDNL